jgi:two-component system sensor histidine kinase DegS
MSTLKINLEVIGKNLPRQFTTIAGLVKKSTELVDQTSGEIKRICTNLHPSVLDGLGLYAALSSYIDGFQSSYGIHSEFNCCEIKERLSFEVERVVYRVVQESLNNIAKHARASELSVNLIDTPSSIIATIEDNGVGFDVKKTLSAQEVNRGLGLLGIKERVSLVKGKVTIKSELGRGTVIRLAIPKNSAEEKGEDDKDINR